MNVETETYFTDTNDILMILLSHRSTFQTFAIYYPSSLRLIWLEGEEYWLVQ